MHLLYPAIGVLHAEVGGGEKLRPPCQQVRASGFAGLVGRAVGKTVALLAQGLPGGRALQLQMLHAAATDVCQALGAVPLSACMQGDFGGHAAYAGADRSQRAGVNQHKAALGAAHFAQGVQPGSASAQDGDLGMDGREGGGIGLGHGWLE